MFLGLPTKPAAAPMPTASVSMSEGSEVSLPIFLHEVDTAMWFY